MLLAQKITNINLAQESKLSYWMKTIYFLKNSHQGTYGSRLPRVESVPLSFTFSCLDHFSIASRVKSHSFPPSAPSILLLALSTKAEYSQAVAFSTLWNHKSRHALQCSTREPPHFSGFEELKGGVVRIPREWNGPHTIPEPTIDTHVPARIAR